MIRTILLSVVAFALIAASVLAAPGGFSCAQGEYRVKTENSQSEDYDRLEAPGPITAVYVKTGRGCLPVDGVCYVITDGGIGYNFVVVERVGDPSPECQGISHLEAEYDPGDDPTPTPTDTPEESTPTPTPTPPDDPTPTPTPPDEPTPTPPSTPPHTGVDG